MKEFHEMLAHHPCPNNRKVISINFEQYCIRYKMLGNFRGDLIIIVGRYPGTVGRYRKQSVVIAQKYQN